MKEQNQYVITIIVNGDQVEVKNFPINANIALECMHRAALTVAKFFIQAGVEGKLQEETKKPASKKLLKVLPKDEVQK